MSSQPATVLFGAFDRHNFGDLLFPHLLEALLPGRRFDLRGLAARDLRPFGGHRVAPLAGAATHLVHAGGELLTCTAWQAAVMLRDPAEVPALVARYDADPDAAAAWAAAALGTARRLPYVVGREALMAGGRLIFHAVGGVEWRLLTPVQRAEATRALRAADWVSVRDRVTQAALGGDGIDAALCPDPAVMVAECFGETIRRHQQMGAVQVMRETFPRGWIACQFSADFADDASLDALARGLAATSRETRWGIALFRAGAAPWHDDPALYERLRLRLPAGMAGVFPSLHLWDICALIAASRAVVSSGLHGRLVALAHGLPRASLAPPQDSGCPGKVAAFAETWEPEDLPRSVRADALEPALRQALAVPADVLQDTAAHLRARYRAGLAQWAGLLPRERHAQ